MSNDFIPCNLTARQIIKSLMPHTAEINQDYIDYLKSELSPDIPDSCSEIGERRVLEEFLLFPTDLFALTSAILSITGAYHLVVSPPRFKDGLSWLPYDESWITQIFGDGDKWKNKKTWVEEVRKIGLKWRLLLNCNFSREQLEKCKVDIPGNARLRLNAIQEKVGILFEKTKNKEKEVVWIPPDDSKKWIPDEVRDYWEVFRFEMSSINFCHEDESGSIEDLLCDEEVFTEQKKTDRLPQIWRAFCSLITLHAIADEACIGWGLREMDDELEENNIEKETYQKYLKDDEIWKEERKKDFQRRRIGRLLKTLAEQPETEITKQLVKDVESNKFNDDDFYKKYKESYEFKEKPQLYAEELLKNYGTMSTINNLRCRVLPKRHTPSVGITLRALSSNLAFHRSSIDVRWRTEYKVKNGLVKRMEKIPINERTFSILLLPWALDISSLDFTTIRSDPRLGMKEDYGFFAYSPKPKTLDETFAQKTLLVKTLNAAKKETPDIDMIILPEYAMEREEIKEFEQIIRQYDVSTYVAGVRNSNKDNAERHFHDNMVLFRVGKKNGTSENEMIHFDEIEPGEIQHKHHRWRLNRSQIETYNLGHILSPNKDWWEAIKIRRRKVTFVNIGEELTVCPLICEDLARQDPIADLIRTVGPSLVITILMDGPQKKERWSARYASVLAEDPGCAIITLSSLGMVKKSLPPNVAPSRVVALWNDGVSFAREIELEEGAAGVLLSISVEARTEVMADGRKETKSTNCVKLGGIHQIYPK